MARRLGREESYAVAQRFVEEALKSDKSLGSNSKTTWPSFDLSST